MTSTPRYRALANHYRRAIEVGSLGIGDRLPSLRQLTVRHRVSLSTVVQACRTLEAEGWVEARDRAGYFVRRPDRLAIRPLAEPATDRLPDPAQYVGIHERVSTFVARQRDQPIRLDLSRAVAAPDLYPGEALRRALLRSLATRPGLLTEAIDARAMTPFREAVARRALRVGMTLAPAEILPTHGCIEALNLALRAVARPGDTVAVESPTFHGLLQVLESLGLRVVEIPTSPRTGLSLDALELAVATCPGLRAVVVVPHLQNPLGSVMPDGAKAALVALAERHDLAVIEDDTYSELLDGRAPPRALKAWDASGRVIHCASMHKILAPGLRLGWIQAGRWHRRVEMLKHAQSRGNAPADQWAVGAFIASRGYDRHLRQFRARLGEQRDRMADAIARWFPSGTRINLPPGGLHLWVELPTGASATAIFEAALGHGILVAPGRLFTNTDRFDGFLRINCGAVWTPALEIGIRQLGSLVAEAGSERRGAPGAEPRPTAESPRTARSPPTAESPPTAGPAAALATYIPE